MPGVQALSRAQILRSRAKFLGSLTELKGKAVVELNGLAGKLDGMIAAQAKTGLIPLDRLKFIQGRINTLVPATTKGIESLLDNQLRVSIETAAIGKQKAGNVFSSFVKVAAKKKGILKIPEINVAFGGGMANFSEELIKQVWDKRWMDGKKLSQRIWNFNRITEKDLLRKVKTGIGEGKSARDISKGLRGYLTKDGRGSPVYRSMRLARTETNEAYKLAHQEIAKRETFVKGTKWNLSGSHKKTDVCDDLAEGGPRGDGVYPVAEYPGTPHPLCLCFPTDETPTVEEFLNRQKEVPGYGWVDKADMPGNEEAGYLKEAMPYAKQDVTAMKHQFLRGKYMSRLGYHREERAISDSIVAWGKGSENNKALWLKAVQNKTFGLPVNDRIGSYSRVVQPLIDSGTMPKIDARTVRGLKAYQAYTDAYLKARKIESMTILRGIHGEQAQLLSELRGTAGWSKVKVDSLSSWTNEESIANMFAKEKGVVLRTYAKRADILTIPDIEPSLVQWGEGEVLLRSAGPKTILHTDIILGEI